MQKAVSSLYSSPEAKQEIHALYHEKLNELGIDYRFEKVATSFGETNVIVTGTEGKPDLFLVHGSNGCAPVAIEALIGLGDHYRIYAPDVLAQPNLSSETRPSMKDHSYGIWANEVLAGLQLDAVYMAGFSFGGLVTWKTLVYDESKIKAAFMIAPAGIVNGNPFKLFTRVFQPMKRFRKTQKAEDRDRFLDALFTEPDKFAQEFLAKVFAHFTMDFSPIPTIKKAEAAKISTPIYLVGAKNDLIFPGEKMLKRVERIFPSIAESLLLDHSKHVQGKADNLKLESWIRNKAN